MWEDDASVNPKWIKVDTNIIFTIDPEETATQFFGIFVEPYFKKCPICLDLRKFSDKDTKKFINVIRKLCDFSENVVFVRNKEYKKK